MGQQATTPGLTRFAVMSQDDGFGKAGLLGMQTALAKRKLQPDAAARCERNTDKVEDALRAIKASDAQVVVMILVNKSTAAFAKLYNESGGGAQPCNI